MTFRLAPHTWVWIDEPQRKTPERSPGKLRKTQQKEEGGIANRGAYGLHEPPEDRGGAARTKHEKKPKPGKTGDKKKWIKTQIAVNSRSIALARLLF